MLNRYLLTVLAGASLVVTATGCGDDVTCPSRLVVVISSPGNGGDVTADMDPDTEGLQTNVQVRSNLNEGDSFTITITGSGGTPVTATGTADATGTVVFENVTLPSGAVTINVEGESREDCGKASDQVSVQVAGTANCVLVIREGPIDNEFYAPSKVLNSSNDSDSALPNFQANIDVTAAEGTEVEVFVLDVTLAQETSAGTMIVDSSGTASFPISLAQGHQALRATCRAAGSSSSGAAPTQFVFIDTEPPTCSIADPAPGTTIIPGMDTDANMANGTQVTFRGHANAAAADDVEGESAEFSVGGQGVLTPDLDADGDTQVTLTFDMVQSYAVAFTAQDHAGNTCTTSASYDYQTDGCVITHVAPTGVITSDSNGNAADGLTADLVVTVDAACAGRTVTTDCDIGAAQTGTVPAGGGTVTIPIKICDNISCTVPARNCTTSVTNAAGITTSAGAIIEADTEAPIVSLVADQPNPLPCGQVVTASIDADMNSGNGVQVVVKLNAVPPPPAGNSWIRLTNASNPGGTDTQVNPQVLHSVTLENGNNTIQAIADDQNGNRGTSAPCTLALAEVAIGVDPPVDDGSVAGQEPGVSVAGSNATFNFCGTVSEAGAAITLDIDSGAQVLNTTATGTTWCVNNVTLSEGNHVYTVTAIAGPRSGVLANQPLTVDVTPPGAPTLTEWLAITRHQGRATWTSGGGDGFLVKWSDSAFTDSTFDSVTSSSSHPSTTSSLVINNLDAGTTYWVGVAAIDSAGNRSTAQILGPITPDFDRSGAIAPSNPQNGDDKHLGWSVTSGLFNSDSYTDVAVAAPFETVSGGNFGGVVYIYLGGPNGLSTTPAYRIESPLGFSLMGYGLTAIQWDADPANRADLAIGSPFQNTVYIINGGAAFDPPGGATLPITLDASVAADSTITVDGSASYLANSNLGWGLAAARFDTDSRDDLVVGLPGGGGGRGGMLILYGGVTADIALSDTSGANMANAQAHLFRNPGTLVNGLFGNRVTNLGPTTRSTDDVAVSRVADALTGDDDRIYVLRNEPGSKPMAGGPVVDRAFVPSRDLSIAPTSGDTSTYFGDTLGTITSVNGDGTRDIVIGAMLHESSAGANDNAGKVFIVSGAAVGNKTVATPTADPTNGIGILQISPSGQEQRLGTMVLNNALSSSPDINNDGLEDLVILGGVEGNSGVWLYIWFGGNLPTSDTTTASANHSIRAPTAFQGNVFAGRIGPLVGAWVGDTNGDGLEDICWADHNASTDSGSTIDGAIEFLDDDGM